MEISLIFSPSNTIAASRAALEAADIVPLVMVLVQFTGDAQLLDRCEPYIKGPFDAQQCIPATLKRELIDRILAILDRYWSSELEMPQAPSEALFVRMMSVAVGRPVPPKYVEMMRDDFKFGAENAGGLIWTRPPERERLERFRVA